MVYAVPFQGTHIYLYACNSLTNIIKMTRLRFYSHKLLVAFFVPFKNGSNAVILYYTWRQKDQKCRQKRRRLWRSLHVNNTLIHYRIVRLILRVFIGGSGLLLACSHCPTPIPNETKGFYRTLWMCSSWSQNIDGPLQRSLMGSVISYQYRCRFLRLFQCR